MAKGPPPCLSRDQINATVGAGMSSQEAASVLRVNPRTIQRIASKFRITMRARRARIRGAFAWGDVFERYGPTARGVARAVGMHHSYVRLQLERHGLIECTIVDQYARDWERSEEGREFMRGEAA
jgi:hypothetical protein